MSNGLSAVTTSPSGGRVRDPIGGRDEQHVVADFVVPDREEHGQDGGDEIGRGRGGRRTPSRSCRRPPRRNSSSTSPTPWRLGWVGRVYGGRGRCQFQVGIITAARDYA